MIHVADTLASAMQDALRQVVPEGADTRCVVSSCHDLRFGDYQCNAAMLAAKTLGRQPRDLAQQIIARLNVGDLCEKADVAGAGFINFHLKPEFVVRQLDAMAADPRDGIAPVARPRRIVLDFSSPNIAKAMHVGHIRSTFLGDALARMLRAAGHTVITDNHLGDWGTQFGMLIYGYKQRLDAQALARSPIAEFERLYREISAESKTHPDVLEAARQELARLHAGDPENLRIWKEISRLSLSEFNKAYARMGVAFDHCLGESFYNPMLPDVVNDLKKLGVVEESEGAACIFFRDDPSLKDAAPMIVQKSDGAFLYATTDLATALHREREWKTEEILYVTDARQQLHFKQLFAAVERWFAAKKTAADGRRLPILKHVTFGSILGADKKPIKTRSGDPIKLNDLLDEAEARALEILRAKKTDFSDEEQQGAARVIGIGALKYADLCQNRNLDYVFDWNKLLALQGNTAPYLINAYVRIRSIFRRGGMDERERLSGVTPALSTPEEIALGKHLIQFGDTIHAVLEDQRPHLLTNYLYELAVRFHKFYEMCPVLQAEGATRASRLVLCDLTGRTLRKGLNLLGIETLERM